MNSMAGALYVRSATCDDAVILQALFASDANHQRLRFLDRREEAGRYQRLRAPDVDHDRTENFVALLNDSCVAAGRLAFDASCSRAEAAIAVQSEHQRQGISWALLEHMRGVAVTRGAHVLEAIIRQEDHDVSQVMKARRFRLKDIVGEPRLLLVSDRLTVC